MAQDIILSYTMGKEILIRTQSFNHILEPSIELSYRKLYIQSITEIVVNI